MADPATPPGDSPDRRDRRRDRNRQQARRVVGIVAGVLAVAAVALVASDLVRLSGEDKPSLAGTVQVTRNDGESRAATTTTGTRSCRPLTVTDPLRLWVGGDSLAGSLGPSLGKLAGATGVVQPYFDSRVSSGLADPGFFDWPDHAATEMPRIDPEVVVFIIGTNDWTAVSGDWKDAYTTKVDTMMKALDGSGHTVYWLGAPTIKDEKTDAAVVEVNAVAQEVAKRHPEVVVFIIGTNDWTTVSGDWKEKYSDTVDSMMKTLIGPGRTVYWLGAPTLKDKEQDDAVVEVNAVAQQVAQRHSKVHYVDTYKLFSDSDGTGSTGSAFAYDLPDEQGNVVTMRAGDGVHLTMDGADYLSRQVYKLIDAQCGVTEQKVEGATKQAIETEGSTQVAPGVTSGSSGGTLATTPPATAAPTTEPATTSPPVTEAPSTTEAPVTTVAPPTTSPGGGHGKP